MLKIKINLKILKNIGIFDEEVNLTMRGGYNIQLLNSYIISF